MCRLTFGAYAVFISASSSRIRASAAMARASASERARASASARSAAAMARASASARALASASARSVARMPTQIDGGVIAEHLIRRRVDECEAVSARLGIHLHAQPQVHRGQPHLPKLVRSHALVGLALEFVSDQSNPSTLPFLLAVALDIGDHVMRHPGESVLLDFRLDVRDPRLGEVTSMINDGQTFSVLTRNVRQDLRRLTPKITARSGL